MELNADYSRRAVVHAARLDWAPSPVAGVARRMLDRIGAEIARATSIVRYAPNSRFSPHSHGGGEEFLVIDGVFTDEHGDFPVGSYIRNPPGTSHTPGSKPGCTIFVKLWQFDPEDRDAVRIDTALLPFVPCAGRPGVEILQLFRGPYEDVRLERYGAGASIDLSVPAGLELLVLDGTLEEGGEQFATQSWLRLPSGAELHAKAGPYGCKAWVKTGHLERIPSMPRPAA